MVLVFVFLLSCILADRVSVFRFYDVGMLDVSASVDCVRLRLPIFGPPHAPVFNGYVITFVVVDVMFKLFDSHVFFVEVWTFFIPMFMRFVYPRDVIY